MSYNSDMVCHYLNKCKFSFAQQTETVHSPFTTHNSLKTAFTLAEVLITLGIIGVVAAMTLPTLIQNSKRQDISARLKKFNSVMQQAILLSENENGIIETWEKKPVAYDSDGNYDKDSNSELSEAFIRKYLAPYLKYVSIEKDESFKNYTKVVLLDGSVFWLRNSGCYDIYFDANGEKNPNEFGKDKFIFNLCPSHSNTSTITAKPFGAYCPKTSCNTREKAIDVCKRNNVMCAGILQLDNWEFKTDYPR